ncbi:MAG: hypothetical protein EZS28_048179 [Streblomastix strix]|uniref:Uncharacterized protein n=1 Tax=Streblomastix strix TaxID=222440 RepID=A0A5J4TD16_9EUKA|nr:MAG: hypothetical protein EZS28_048179 [Streblomastix strix]
MSIQLSNSCTFQSSKLKSVPLRIGGKKTPFYLLIFHSFLVSRTTDVQERYNLKAETIKTGDLQSGKKQKNKKFITLVKGRSYDDKFRTSIGMEYVDQDEKDDEKNDNNDGIYDDIDSDQDSIPLSELLDQSDINQMDAKGSCASAEIKETSVGPYIFHEIRIV